jgi:hypothetical protein
VFWWRNLKKRDNLEGVVADGKGNNIKMDVKDIRWEGMDWISLAQRKNTWRAVVNTVMNVAGNLQTS